MESKDQNTTKNVPILITQAVRVRKYPSAQTVTATYYSLFNAFFLFSAFVVALPVADLLTAFVAPVGSALFSMLSPKPGAGLVFPPTLASAVARGDGDGWRSLSLTIPSFSEVRVALRSGCGEGEADFRVTTGTGRRDGGMEEVEGGGTVSIVADIAGAGLEEEGEAEGAEDDVAEGGDSAGGGSLNSTGLTRGVACTLVINLARLQ